MNPSRKSCGCLPLLVGWYSNSLIGFFEPAYKTVKDYFLEQEELNEATYLVLRCQHYDVSRLEYIEKQAHLLSLQQVLILGILQAEIKASYFYSRENFLGYSTSYEPQKHLREHRSNQFDKYLIGDGKQNISWNGMFISVFKALDSYLIIQHNDALNDEKIGVAETYIDIANKRYQECVNEIEELNEKEW